MISRLALWCLWGPLFCWHVFAAPGTGEPPSIKDNRVSCHGYDDCIALENRDTRVVINGACGGHVLEYSLNGVNTIYLADSDIGKSYKPGDPTFEPYAGRFDIGPELMPQHPNLFIGRWEAVRTGTYSARMSSVADPVTGVRLVRDFSLDPHSSRLTVTQTIHNVSPQTVRYYYWIRTLALPGGVCIVPLHPGGPFPNQVVQWEPDWRINFAPKDPQLVRRGDMLFITGPMKNSKVGVAMSTGKIGYLMPNDLLFIKEFAVYPDRVYGGMVAMNLCVCYQTKFCELEPIGPQEVIKPGGSASYTETWTLRQHPFPKNGELDFEALCNLVR